MKWNHSNITDQSGKNIIITGANSGIGFESALVLAKHGAEVTLACRNEKRGNDAIKKIVNEVPNAKVSLEILDLASFDSVKAFADRYNASHSKLDILINNAGIMMTPLARSDDGFENQLQANYLGHFALTGHLLELLEKGDEARVISLSSIAHNFGRISFTNFNAEKKYNRIIAYAQSKLACLMFSFELERRLRKINSTITSVAAHPGLSKSNLMGHNKVLDAGMQFIGTAFGMSSKQGALPMLYAATNEEIKGGTYYGPDGLLGLKGYPIEVKHTDYSKKSEVADRMWRMSEELTGVEYW